MVDFREQLQRQLSFIITSCHAYDHGFRQEAIRVAQAARILFHDTKTSQSLVRTHLGVQDLKLRSTASDVLSPNGYSLGFIGLEPSSGGFRPFLDDVDRDQEVPFNTWWREEAIMRLFQGEEVMTRRQLILAAANTDGGAHVDSNVPSEYDRLESGDGIQLEVGLATGERRLVTLRFANLAALRQIGHEILTSPQLTALVPLRVS